MYHSLHFTSSVGGPWGYSQLSTSQRWQTYHWTYGMLNLWSANIHGGAGSPEICNSRGPALLGISAVHGGVSFALGFGGNNAFSQGDVIDVFENKKTTMQNLNDRMAIYLEKVHSLEKINNDLELKIRQFLDNKSSPKSQDYSAFYTTISDLHGKVLHAIRVNSSINLNISNARLTTDDFRVKFKNELNIRLSVGADVASLRKLRDELTLVRSDLEMNIKELRGDLDMLKNNHEEELLVLQAQKTKEKVNVEVNAKPHQDLSKGLDEFRQQYESIIAKNLGDVQLWFHITKHSETIGSHKTEITDLKSTLQNLEIALQSELSQKASLKATLEDTEAHYSTILARYQLQITSKEEVLAQLRAELESKKQDCMILLTMRTRLELEITEYRSLLDREAGSAVLCNWVPVSLKTVETVVEEVVERKVVSTTNKAVNKDSKKPPKQTEHKTS
uniref:IF rod domain-containing protein n=1 Tax=Electrophorus electricus TaxID=8005 RepID=A0A4W4G913_ELEEL